MSLEDIIDRIIDAIGNHDGSSNLIDHLSSNGIDLGSLSASEIDIIAKHFANQAAALDVPADNMFQIANGQYLSAMLQFSDPNDC